LASADLWRWTDDEGVQRLLSGEELRIALTDGRLKPTTLVWKRGMKSWVPAADVPELMSRGDGVDTVTKPRAAIPGNRAEPTPSVPPAHVGADGKVRPSNMIDIAALRAQAGGPAGTGGQRHQTMRHGTLGSADRQKDAGARAEVQIPAAPKLPTFGSAQGFSIGSKPAAAGRPGRTEIEGLWKEPSDPPDGGWRLGAARKDKDEEDTVTRVRAEDEGSTMTAPKQKQAPPPRRSVPPPRKLQPTAPTALPKTRSKPPPPPAAARAREALAPTQISPTQRSPSKAPAPVPSGAVLSDHFEAMKGDPSGELGSDDKRRTTKMTPSALEAAAPAARAPAPPPREPPVAAAPPLPERRPAEPSRPAGPAFASEPWQRREASVPPAGPSFDVAPVSAARTAEPPMGLPAQSYIPTAIPPPPAGAALTVKVPILLGIGAGALLLLVLSFVFGRVSAPDGATAVANVRTGWAAVPIFARMHTSGPALPRGCLMLRAPSRLAPAATQRVPMEVAVSGPDTLAVGYAKSPLDAGGMIVMPRTGEAKIIFEPPTAETEISRVMPLANGGEQAFAVTLLDDQALRNAVQIESELLLGFDGVSLVRASARDAAPEKLWTLAPPGGDADALVATAVEDDAVAVAFRYGGQIHYGTLDKKGAMRQEPAQIAGSGGQVGRPSLASNGDSVSVVFADKPAPTAPVEIRWARGPLGEPLKDAIAVELPSGGPGGDAIAPAIAALPGGHWLLMWTEGRTGAYVQRAQTYDRAYRPVGEALRVSPGTGSFGQGVVGVVGDSAVVLFLLASAGRYEVWGTVLQCR
jgi:hypothetical protein